MKQGRGSSRQLARQRGWLIEHWRYLLRQRVLPRFEGRTPTCLDVGCGPGLVMESLADLMRVQGLDHDRDMVEGCRARGLQATLGRAEELPYEDASFDVVYCSFLLVWVEDPLAVLKEMLRVSKGQVLCLAEPDYAARVDHPPELAELTYLIVDGTKRAGGDPCMGRKLRSLFSELGMEAEIGIHPGAWSLERLRAESEAEWEWAKGMVGDAPEDRMRHLRGVWDRALAEGTLFQHNPIFYALGKGKDDQTDRLSRQK
jgi:SAM-dependent methyltransferase